jgi:hypothetical protein
MKDTRHERELLWKLIKDIRFAMFTPATATAICTRGR